MPILYDVKSPYQILLRYKGTLWELVFSNYAFWFIIAECILFTVLRMTGTLTSKDRYELPDGLLNSLGSLVTFSVVFFLDRVYDRFLNQLSIMRALKRDIINLALIGKVEFNKSGKNYYLKLARYSVTLFHITFYEIANIKKGSYFVSSRLLTEIESDQIYSYEGSHRDLLALWMHDLVGKSFERGFIKDTEIFRDLVKSMHEKSETLYYFTITPPPLGYYHLMLTTLHTWLILFAYEAPFTTKNPDHAWIISIGVFVCVFAYVGMETLSFVHVDPWGNDTTDVNVLDEMDDVFQKVDIISKTVIYDNFDSVEMRPPPLSIDRLVPVKTPLPNILRKIEENTSLFPEFFKDRRTSELNKIIEFKHKL